MISAVTTSEDVYVAGFQTIGAAGSYVRAKYWVNGVGQELEQDSQTMESEAHDIFVSGNDVYVSGLNKRYGFPRNAVYWKNGKRVELTTGRSDGIGNAISVSGEDVYVAGTIGSEATVWKNGRIMFTDSYHSSSARSMFVNGSDIHLIGHGYNDTNAVIAKYWKNGQSLILSHKSKGGQGNSVFVSGSDVYTAGYDRADTIAGVSASARAKYWKNGAEVFLAEAWRYSTAEGIYVAGSNIYVSGSLDEKPAYWKNGVATMLPSGRNSVTTGISVLGNDVYVCGYELFQYGTVAIYWKNGVRVELTPRIESTAMAFSIVVK